MAADCRLKVHLLVIPLWVGRQVGGSSAGHLSQGGGQVDLSCLLGYVFARDAAAAAHDLLGLRSWGHLWWCWTLVEVGVGDAGEQPALRLARWAEEVGRRGGRRSAEPQPLIVGAVAQVEGRCNGDWVVAEAVALKAVRVCCQHPAAPLLLANLHRDDGGRRRRALFILHHDGGRGRRCSHRFGGWFPPGTFMLWVRRLRQRAQGPGPLDALTWD